MITAGYRKYSYQAAENQVINFLKQNKENPYTIEEISYATRLERDTVAHVLNELQYKTELCRDKDRYYFPSNKMRWWLVAFGLVIACTYTFCGLIKYYHL